MSVLLKLKRFQPNANIFLFLPAAPTPHAAQRLTLGPSLRSCSGILEYVQRPSKLP